jgi:hypothetical protein
MSGEYEVDVDPERNRLYLTLAGLLDAETAEAHAEDMLAAADELSPGFDISPFTPMDDQATDTIERGKRGLTERGVSAVVSVTGESVVGKLPFDRVADGEEEYHVATAETVEEADAPPRVVDDLVLPDEPVQRTGDAAGDGAHQVVGVVLVDGLDVELEVLVVLQLLDGELRALALARSEPLVRAADGTRDAVPYRAGPASPGPPPPS